MEMQGSLSETSSVRLAEVIGALSVATDLGMGHPLEFALSSCILAVRLSEELGFSAEDQRGVFYQALLRYVGCNVETHLQAALIGDEIALRHDFATVNNGRQSDVIKLISRYLRQANAGSSPLQLARAMTLGLMEMSRVSSEIFVGHCEVAQRLAERLELPAGVVESLGQLYERWDGKGLPRGIKGEAITQAVRVVTLAQDVVTFYRLGGIDDAIATVRERRGSAYDPAVADRFLERSRPLLDGLDDEPAWETVLELEPGERVRLSGERFQRACEAMADFADLKSPYTLGHSHGVARLASDAARRCNLPQADCESIRQAGLLHDLGRSGISAGIWMKSSPLTSRDWDKIRLYPYYTSRVLARPGPLGRLASLAGSLQERLDGSGYHRALSADAIPPGPRILAAADVYQSLREDRPYRPARDAEDAANVMRREARDGRLDVDAADAVLASAGHRVPRRPNEIVGGLSQREIEVLRLVARGHSMKEIADRIFISRKTVDNHIQHIYAKTGVTTRAGATLFAIEQHLLEPLSD